MSWGETGRAEVSGAVVQWCSGAVVQWCSGESVTSQSALGHPGITRQVARCRWAGREPRLGKEGKGRDRRFSIGVCVGFRFLQGSPPINNTPKNSPLIISLSLYSSLSSGEYNTRTLDSREAMHIYVYT
jgi:hypothetical protein